MGRSGDRDHKQPPGVVVESWELDVVVVVVQPLKGPVVGIVFETRNRDSAKRVRK